jgi:hypothetical protein
LLACRQTPANDSVMESTSADESGDSAGDGRAYSPSVSAGSSSLMRSSEPRGDVGSTGTEGGNKTRSRSTLVQRKSRLPNQIWEPKVKQTR